MTYCVAIRPDSGLVFLADSRTNAGVDQVSTFRKLSVFERPGERVMVLMSAGNLALSQAVRSLLSEGISETEGVWAAPTMFDAARRVGEAVREVYRREAHILQAHDVSFNISLLLGGQIGQERCRLFQIYAAGNFIEASDENVYFQIGESKYGKPILDRLANRHSSVDDAAKCALLSMDSTLRSNISVGMPLDLLVYEADSLRLTRFASIDANNRYFRMLRTAWGDGLRELFDDMPEPAWSDPASPDALAPAGLSHEPVRAAPSGHAVATLIFQTLAQSDSTRAPDPGDVTEDDGTPGPG